MRARRSRATDGARRDRSRIGGARTAGQPHRFAVADAPGLARAHACPMRGRAKRLARGRTRQRGAAAPGDPRARDQEPARGDPRGRRSWSRASSIPKDRPLTDLIADEVDRIAAADRPDAAARSRAAPSRIAPLNLHEAMRRALRHGARSGHRRGPRSARGIRPVAAPGARQRRRAGAGADQSGRQCARRLRRTRRRRRSTVRTRFVSGLVCNVIRLGRPVRCRSSSGQRQRARHRSRACATTSSNPSSPARRTGRVSGLALVRKLVRDMDGRIAHERDERGRADAFPHPSAVAKQGESDAQERPAGRRRRRDRDGHHRRARGRGLAASIAATAIAARDRLLAARGYTTSC